MGEPPAVASPAERLAAFERAKGLLAPVEVERAPKFRSRTSLVAHVRKHVLEGKEERWKELLDADTIHRARVEAGAVGGGGVAIGAALERLARAYEALVGEALRSACAAGTGHGHSGAVALTEDGRGFSVDRYSVMAWHRGQRLVIVATAHVREGVLRPYMIRTGFRDTGRMTDRRFAVRWTARLKEQARTRGESIVAIHDLDAGGTPDAESRPRQGQPR